MKDKQAEHRTIATAKKITQLKKRVLEARLGKTSIKLREALDYEILRQALELLGATIAASQLKKGPGGGCD